MRIASGWSDGLMANGTDGDKWLSTHAQIVQAFGIRLPVRLRAVVHGSNARMPRGGWSPLLLDGIIQVVFGRLMITSDLQCRTLLPRTKTGYNVAVTDAVR